MRTFFLITLACTSITAMADLPHEHKSPTGLHRYLSHSLGEDDDDMRTQNYPTQVMRMTVNVEGKRLSCDAIDKETDKRTKFLDDDDDGFMYRIRFFCQSDDLGRTAISYSIDGFFDPLTDVAITKLEKVLAKYNGTDFFGTPWNIESAEGVATAITFDIGNKAVPKEKELHLLFQYNQSLYFNNYYDMTFNFIKEMKSNFMNNDKDTVVSFINKWLSPNASASFISYLSESNYIHVYPALMFIMEKEPRAYFPESTMNFIHSCLQYPSKKCIG